MQLKCFMTKFLLSLFLVLYRTSLFCTVKSGSLWLSTNLTVWLVRPLVHLISLSISCLFLHCINPIKAKKKKKIHKIKSKIPAAPNQHLIMLLLNFQQPKPNCGLNAFVLKASYCETDLESVEFALTAWVHKYLISSAVICPSDTLCSGDP